MSNSLNLAGTVAESFTSQQSDTDGILCNLVPDEQRIAFWPQYFGNIPQWTFIEPPYLRLDGPALRYIQRRHLESLHAQQRWRVYSTGD